MYPFSSMLYLVKKSHIRSFRSYSQLAHSLIYYCHTLQLSHYNCHTTTVTLQLSHYNCHTATVTLQLSHYNCHTTTVTLKLSTTTVHFNSCTCRQCVGEDTTADHPLEHTEKLIQSMTPPHSSSPLPHPSSTPSLRSTTPPPDDESVLSVTIHHCTALQPHSLLRHPLVKVHFVNANTGEYLLKTNRCTCHMTSYDITRSHDMNSNKEIVLDGT